MIGAGIAANQGDLSDVPDSQGFQAFSCIESQRFSIPPKGVVNHAGQALVNHTGRMQGE